MRRWAVLALLVVAAIALTVSASEFFRQPPEPAIVSKVESITTDVPPSRIDAKPESVAPPFTPDVDSKQLLAHVNALNYKRYKEADRDRVRNYLTQSLKQSGWSPQLQPFEGGVNIFAQRQGTDKQAGAILVAAHYDTVAVSPGADDNATGVAVVLELARLFGSRPTPATLQLAFFDLEERGLVGSRAFAANKANLENLRGAIVMDMVGYACYKPGCQRYPEKLPIAPPTDTGNFLAAVGDAEHPSLLDAFQDAFQTNGKPGLPPVLTLPVPFKGMLAPDVLRSDHAPFWYKGVGAVLLTDTANLRTPHYHQSSDIPATLDRSFFTGSAQIVVNATAKLLERS